MHDQSGWWRRAQPGLAGLGHGPARMLAPWQGELGLHVGLRLRRRLPQGVPSHGTSLLGAHVEANFRDNWMMLHYMIGRDLWVIAVHMPTTLQSAEKYKDAMNDLGMQMEKIATEKREPRVLVGGDWNAAWPARKGILEDYYGFHGDGRGATVGQLMKWNISGPDECVGRCSRVSLRLRHAAVQEARTVPPWPVGATAAAGGLRGIAAGVRGVVAPGLRWEARRRAVRISGQAIPHDV